MDDYLNRYLETWEAWQQQEAERFGPNISDNELGLMLADYFDLMTLRCQCYTGALSPDALPHIQESITQLDELLDAASMDMR